MKENNLYVVSQLISIIKTPVALGLLRMKLCNIRSFGRTDLLDVGEASVFNRNIESNRKCCKSVVTLCMPDILIPCSGSGQ